MSRVSDGDIVRRTVSRTLDVSSGVAVVVLAVGVAAWLLFGAHPAAARTPIEWLGAWPIAIIGVGLLLVTLTPFVQLAAALGAFARTGERREALAAALVLAILLASAVGAFIFGKGST